VDQVQLNPDYATPIFCLSYSLESIWKWSKVRTKGRFKNFYIHLYRLDDSMTDGRLSRCLLQKF